MSVTEPPGEERPEERAGTLYHVSMPIEERVYLGLASCFVTLLVLTNVIGPKLFTLFGATLTAGIITYPLTFLVTDIVSEIFGKKRADRMVVLGFAMSLLMLAIVQISIYLPPSDIRRPPGFESSEGAQAAWFASFGVGPWLVSGSMLAYLVAQLCDNFFFHFWRRVTRGRHLWLRNNGSTLISQLVDTFIVNSFLFYGAFGMPFVPGLKLMGVIYLFKLGIALLDTPLCYLGIWWVRRLLRSRGALPV